MTDIQVFTKYSLKLSILIAIRDDDTKYIDSIIKDAPREFMGRDLVRRVIRHLEQLGLVIISFDNNKVTITEQGLKYIDNNDPYIFRLTI